MNDTLSTPNPAHQVYDVRRIIRERGGASCEATLLAIRRVVEPDERPRPPAGSPDPRPIETDEHGWPMLNPEGTAWERHDEPHDDDPDTRP